MAPHKIIAATTTEALKLVREQVGGDALVLSTRDTPEGVEIVAISPEALAKMSQRTEVKVAPAASPSADLAATFKPPVSSFSPNVPLSSANAPAAQDNTQKTNASTNCWQSFPK
jgi:flagellar biosynthesis protein FlhF